MTKRYFTKGETPASQDLPSKRPRQALVELPNEIAQHDTVSSTDVVALLGEIENHLLTAGLQDSHDTAVESFDGYDKPFSIGTAHTDVEATVYADSNLCDSLPSFVLPPMRARSVGVAPVLGQPSRDRPSSITRLGDPVFTQDSDFESLDIPKRELASVFDAIWSYLRTRDAGPEDEYSRLISKLSSAQACRIYVSSMVSTSAPIIAAFFHRTIPTWDDLANAATVTSSFDFNYPGVYIHTGRVDDTAPCQNGVYIGSGTGETADSNHGVAGLVGLLRRIVCQHGSARYRHYENKKKVNGVAHYRMYQDTDSPKDHVYKVLNFLTIDELVTILAHANPLDVNVSKDILYSEKQERTAMTRILETTNIVLGHLYTNDKKFNEFLRSAGFEIRNEIAVIRLNRSIGLELVNESQAQFVERCRQGGILAQYAFARLAGLPEGNKISLSAYIRIRRGADAFVRAGSAAGGWAVRDKKMIRLAEDWSKGLPVQRDFAGSFVPEFRLTKEAGEVVRAFVPPELAKLPIHKIGLPVAISAKDEFGRPRKAGLWPRPQANSLWWSLNLGEVDDDGIPTGIGMNLTCRTITDSSLIYPNPPIQDVQSALVDESRSDFVFRRPGVALRYNESAARIWDQERDLVTTHGIQGHRFNHVERWRLFVVYVQYIFTMLYHQ
ncbi:hypothetical protein V866_003171 [Kwoniella sp. B9012]